MKLMRDQARCVIIGGGITSCSIAYHLARKGWTDIILLEKGELTSETTFHSAGLVSHDQFKSLQRQVSSAKALGMDVGVISPAEALEIFGERLPAQVTADALYDPQGERLRV